MDVVKDAVNEARCRRAFLFPYNARDEKDAHKRGQVGTD